MGILMLWRALLQHSNSRNAREGEEKGVLSWLVCEWGWRDAHFIARVGGWLTYRKLCLVPNTEEGESINIKGQRYRSDDTTQLGKSKNIFSY